MKLTERFYNYGRLVRFSHTIFALPFAMASVALAAPMHPVSLTALVWILVAMVAARTAAMSFNRLADRKFDALNPRTSTWELPQGKVKAWEAGFLAVFCALIFIYAAYRINRLCFFLSPLALAILFFYSVTKRFTWASHLFLGLALSLAPLGAWLAVTGSANSLSDLSIPIFLGLAVLFWLAGFDVIYALQDYEFDRSYGLHSIPARFGVVQGLRFSGFFHLLTVFFLALVGLTARLGLIYWTGLAIVSLILFWEHRVVKPGDLSRINRAFFDLNAYVSVGYFIATLADLLLITGRGNDL
ncbi:MAG: UbiA family prenyltransferase [Deltaproteobacteria bacterium]|nr:UbiA family prenyltransferase [Deltaproteobacteria bacterium]